MPTKRKPEGEQRFGDTIAGAGLGCAAVILAIGASLAALAWAINHAP